MRVRAESVHCNTQQLYGGARSAASEQCGARSRQLHQTIDFVKFVLAAGAQSVTKRPNQPAKLRALHASEEVRMECVVGT